jgi:hypothetical protein
MLIRGLSTVNGESVLYVYTARAQKNGAVSKVNNNLFLTLHWLNIHCQQR